MKTYLKAIIILVFLGILFFFSEDIFILSIRWIPAVNVSIAFWAPLVISFAIGITTILFFKKEIKSTVHKVVASLIFIGICFTSFYSNPFYPEDFENRPTTLTINDEIQKVYLSDTKVQTTCYLLVTCPFCEIASVKLDALHRSGKLNNIEFVYYAYQKTADSLVNANNISIPYRVIENDSIFFLRAGKVFPSVQFNNGKELVHWAGNNVNFACFDYLIANGY